MAPSRERNINTDLLQKLKFLDWVTFGPKSVTSFITLAPPSDFLPFQCLLSCVVQIRAVSVTAGIQGFQLVLFAFQKYLLSSAHVSDQMQPELPLPTKQDT